MTSVSYSVNRGQCTFNASDVTISNLAPNAGDVEIRWNILDGQSHNMNNFELIVACKTFIHWLETGGSAVGGNSVTGLSTQPSGPPN